MNSGKIGSSITHCSLVGNVYSVERKQISATYWTNSLPTTCPLTAGFRLIWPLVHANPTRYVLL